MPSGFEALSDGCLQATTLWSYYWWDWDASTSPRGWYKALTIILTVPVSSCSNVKRGRKLYGLIKCITLDDLTKERVRGYRLWYRWLWSALIHITSVKEFKTGVSFRYSRNVQVRHWAATVQHMEFTAFYIGSEKRYCFMIGYENETPYSRGLS